MSVFDHEVNCQKAGTAVMVENSASMLVVINEPMVCIHISKMVCLRWDIDMYQ